MGGSATRLGLREIAQLLPTIRALFGSTLRLTGNSQRRTRHRYRVPQA